MQVRVHVQILDVPNKLKEQFTGMCNHTSIHTIIELWMLTTIISRTNPSK
jgi:hypothetical protein